MAAPPVLDSACTIHPPVWRSPWMLCDYAQCILIGALRMTLAYMCIACDAWPEPVSAYSAFTDTPLTCPSPSLHLPLTHHSPSPSRHSSITRPYLHHYTGSLPPYTLSGCGRILTGAHVTDGSRDSIGIGGRRHHVGSQATISGNSWRLCMRCRI